MTGDKTGRKLAVAIGLVCNLVGAVLQIAAFHLPMMLVGRIINGFGMGECTAGWSRELMRHR
jgi:MFS family permease